MSDQYLVLPAGSWDDTHKTFADALAEAEQLARTDSITWEIFRLDTTVELVNGIIVVRDGSDK